MSANNKDVKIVKLIWQLYHWNGVMSPLWVTNRCFNKHNMQHISLNTTKVHLFCSWVYKLFVMYHTPTDCKGSFAKTSLSDFIFLNHVFFVYSGSNWSILFFIVQSREYCINQTFSKWTFLHIYQKRKGQRSPVPTKLHGKASARGQLHRFTASLNMCLSELYPDWFKNVT